MPQTRQICLLVIGGPCRNRLSRHLNQLGRSPRAHSDRAPHQSPSIHDRICWRAETHWCSATLACRAPGNECGERISRELNCDLIGNGNCYILTRVNHPPDGVSGCAVEFHSCFSCAFNSHALLTNCVRYLLIIVCGVLYAWRMPTLACEINAPHRRVLNCSGLPRSCGRVLALTRPGPKPFDLQIQPAD